MLTMPALAPEVGKGKRQIAAESPVSKATTRRSTTVLPLCGLIWTIWGVAQWLSARPLTGRLQVRVLSPQIDLDAALVAPGRGGPTRVHLILKR